VAVYWVYHCPQPQPATTTMKRFQVGQPLEALAAKVQKQQAALPEGQGETWACQKCGNENWPGRKTCNRKMCGAPGPWTCQCGNENFQGRMTCNRKVCGMPFPHGGAAVGAGKGGCKGGGGKGDGMWGPLAAMIGGMGGGMGKGGGKGADPGMWVTQSDLAEFVTMMGGMQGGGGPARVPASGPSRDGSWICDQCQNTNFAGRKTCHQQGCEQQGPWKCSCGNHNFQGRLVCNRKVCGLGRPGADEVASAHPQREGDWLCECGNVNWAQRMKCNRKTCGNPKPQ